MGNHLDLICAKLRSTEEELQKTKEHLDLACIKLKNTEEELHSTKDQFEETTAKLKERINALENKPSFTRGRLMASIKSQKKLELKTI